MHRRLAGLLFVVSLVVYLADGGLQPGNDTRATVDLPANVLLNGRLAFAPEEWPQIFNWIHQADGTALPERPGYFLIDSEQVDDLGRPVYVNTYGIGAGLTALPVYAAASLVGFDLEQRQVRWILARLTAAMCAAGIVALAFLIAVPHVSVGVAAWVAVAVGFGTSVWSTSSQALSQHGPAQLFLLLGIWCLLRQPGTPWLRAAAGAAFGWAVLCRPTSLLVTVLAGGYLLLTERRSLLAYCLGGAPIAFVLLAYNTFYFGSPFRIGQMVMAETLHAQADLWATPFWLGAAGQLISPSRGLLVYSPFLVAAFAGAILVWRRGGDRGYRLLSLAAIGLLCVDVKWFAWWGGWSYGYRLKADAAVLLALLLIPVWPVLQRHRLARLPFLVALAWSIGVQWLGAWSYDYLGWDNRTFLAVRLPDQEVVLILPEQAATLSTIEGATVLGPVQADVDNPAFRYRLWSLGDSQILYYASHFEESRANKQRLIQQLWQ